MGAVMSVVHWAALLLHSHLHHDWLQRIVGLIPGGRYDLVDEVEATEHFAEDRVTAIQPAILSHAGKNCEPLSLKSRVLLLSRSMTDQYNSTVTYASMAFF